MDAFWVSLLFRELCYIFTYPSFASNCFVIRLFFGLSMSPMKPFEKLIGDYYIPDAHAEVLTYLYIASYKMDAKTEEITQRFGISRAQFNILNLLNQQYPEPSTIGSLRNRTLVTKSDVSRIVKRLQKAGLVESSVDENDRRLVNVVISEKGRNLFAKIVENRQELLRPFEKLSEGEVLSMKTLLKKLLAEVEAQEKP